MVFAKFAHTTQHGAIKDKEQQPKTEFYNLDVIILVGCRVKSVQGTQFPYWTQKAAVHATFVILRNALCFSSQF